MLNSRFTSDHPYENILATWIGQTYDTKTSVQKEKLIDDITKIFITEPCFVLHIQSYFGWLCTKDEIEIEVGHYYQWEDPPHKYAGRVVSINGDNIQMRGRRGSVEFEEWVPKEAILGRWKSVEHFEPHPSMRIAPGGWKDCLRYLVHRSKFPWADDTPEKDAETSRRRYEKYRKFKEDYGEIASITAGVASLGPRAAEDVMEGGQRTRIGSIKRKKKTKRRKHKKHKGGTKRRRRKRRSKHRKRSIN
jgi:hypothetical protein